jgi:hypothetical protein
VHAAEAEEVRNEMKEVGSDMNDELREEYDLSSLRVRKLGRVRKSFGGTIRLDPDSLDSLPEAESTTETSTPKPRRGCETDRLSRSNTSRT